MPTNTRRQALLLAVLVGALAGILWWNLSGGDAPVTAGPPPPIPLKFIGIVEGAERHMKLAALSDGRFTYYGREGDIIDGRYRIVRIGLESIEMVHVDGRGPQTIRLSGS